MTEAASTDIKVLGKDSQLGFTEFQFGSFKFRRDEYFAHVAWPKGTRIIEVDRFLRALVRDIGWQFFYGWIFFDDVFGTQNHYGTVDIFAGTYDGGYKAAKTDFMETFPTDKVVTAFDTIARDWISEGYDPLRAPQETGTPLGSKREPRKDALVRGFTPAKRMLGLPGDVTPRSDQT
ncbi:MAG TPA: hypothetical protein VH020_05475, partial [Stellaceae bacterium]|nr:hypothetical protein [Stellaceae bacterium]